MEPSDVHLEKVRSRRLGERLAGAGVLAITLSVLAAVAAPAVLTRPAAAPTSPASEPLAAAPGPGADSVTPAPTPSRASASPRATSTPPRLEILSRGPLPDGRLLVDVGQLRWLDLETGGLGPPLAASAWPTRAFALADGGWLCLCVARDRRSDRTTITPTIRVLDETGRELRSFELPALTGEPDPRVRRDENGDSVVLSGALSPDGRFLFLGRAVRHPPSWLLGVDLVDLERGRIVDRLDLGERPTNRLDAGLAGPIASGAPTPEIAGGVFAWAPEVAVAPNGRHASIRITVVAGNIEIETSDLIVSVRDGRLAGHVDLPEGGPRNCGPTWRFADERVAYEVCPDGGAWSIRRATVGGEELPAIRLERGERLNIFSWLRDTRTGSLYGWDPFRWWIARIDPVAGTVEAEATVPRQAAAADTLGEAGRVLAAWIAPPAVAKVWLQPGLALSPDGTRLYAIVMEGMRVEEAGRSVGLVVLDARTLELVDRWSAPEDLVSIAASPDGRWVYTSTLAARDAVVSATVVVLDAATGEPRLAVRPETLDRPILFPGPDGP